MRHGLAFVVLALLIRLGRYSQDVPTAQASPLMTFPSHAKA
jgi:hypothetical protein